MHKVPVNQIRTRLQRAAVELFQERGFESVTAAEIAQRVGVTERTFFRHFADKREVLFDGESALLDLLSRSIGAAPPDAAPVDVLFASFRETLPLLRANRSFSVPRQAIISATPGLRERELAKHAHLADALAGLLRARGTEEMRASLAAHTSMTAFVQGDARVDRQSGPDP